MLAQATPIFTPLHYTPPHPPYPNPPHPSMDQFLQQVRKCWSIWLTYLHLHLEEQLGDIQKLTRDSLLPHYHSLTWVRGWWACLVFLVLKLNSIKQTLLLLSEWRRGPMLCQDQIFRTYFPVLSQFEIGGWRLGCLWYVLTDTGLLVNINSPE